MGKVSGMSHTSVMRRAKKGEVRKWRMPKKREVAWMRLFVALEEVALDAGYGSLWWNGERDWYLVRGGHRPGVSMQQLIEDGCTLEERFEMEWPYLSWKGVTWRSWEEACGRL